MIGILLLFFFFVSFPFILILITIIASIAILSDSILAFIHRPSKEEKVIHCVTGLKLKGLYEDEKLKEMCYNIK